MITCWLNHAYCFQFPSIEESKKHFKFKHSEAENSDKVDTESHLFIILPQQELRCQFQCNLCPFYHLGSSLSVQHHMKEHGSGGNVLCVCRVCKQEFENSESVILHSKAHNSEYGSIISYHILAKQTRAREKGLVGYNDSNVPNIHMKVKYEENPRNGTTKHSKFLCKTKPCKFWWTRYFQLMFLSLTHIISIPADYIVTMERDVDFFMELTDVSNTHHYIPQRTSSEDFLDFVFFIIDYVNLNN